MAEGCRGYKLIQVSLDNLSFALQVLRYEFQPGLAEMDALLASRLQGICHRVFFLKLDSHTPEPFSLQFLKVEKAHHLQTESRLVALFHNPHSKCRYECLQARALPTFDSPQYLRDHGSFQNQRILRS